MVIRPKKVADDDLNPGIRGVLDEVRTEFGPYGWKVHAEKIGEKLIFEFRNPLSPIATGIHFEPRLLPGDLRKYLDEHMSQEPEFAHTRLVDPPRRKRKLLGRLRWAATWYGWSDRVFQEVIETLLGSRTLSKEEWIWLMAVGPNVLNEDLKGKLNKRRKSERRRAKADRVLEVGSAITGLSDDLPAKSPRKPR